MVRVGSDYHIDVDGHAYSVPHGLHGKKVDVLQQSGGLVDMPTDDGGSTKVVLLPLLMGGRRPGVRHALPRIGEHTEEVLNALVHR